MTYQGHLHDLWDFEYDGNPGIEGIDIWERVLLLAVAEQKRLSTNLSPYEIQAIGAMLSGDYERAAEILFVYCTWRHAEDIANGGKE